MKIIQSADEIEHIRRTVKLSPLAKKQITFEEYWAQSVDGIRKDGLYTMEQVRGLMHVAFDVARMD